MKKLLMLALIGFLITSCSVDDDGANISYEFAPITDYDFPEFFEPGKSYDLKLTYELPSSCNTFLGFDGGRQNSSDQEFFIYALTSRDLDQTDCDTEDESLSTETTIRDFLISANISEDEVFTFNLWTGKDASGDPIFTEVVVPVGEPVTEQP